MSVIPHIQMLIFLFSFLPVAFGDYTCICNYNVEKTIYSEKSEQGQPIGFMYEFDCKAQVAAEDGGWFSIAFEHQIGYIYKDAHTTAQLCPGSPPTADIVTTTMAPVRTTLQLNKTTSESPGGSSSVISATQTFPTFTSTRQSTKMSTTTGPSSSVTTTSIDKSTTIVTVSSSVSLPEISPTPSANPYSTTLYQSTHSSLSTKHLTSTTSPDALEHSSKIALPFNQTTTAPPTSTMSTEATTIKSIPTTHKMLSCQDLLQDITNQDNGTIFAYGEKCFELLSIPTTWVNAELECRRKGGHLTEIANSIEQRVVYQVVNTYYHNSVWIGLHDIHHEENFEWTTGTPVVYTHWYPGRKDPDRHFNEDCVAMGMNKYAGQWEDRPCSELRGFVCQFGKHSMHAPVVVG